MSGKALVAVLLILFSHPSSAQAWGMKGHRIIAAIAEAYLHVSTRAEVAMLLRGKTLVEVSTYLDEIRQQRKETGPWHFVNLPRAAREYDAARDWRRRERMKAEPAAPARLRDELDVWDLVQPLLVSVIVFGGVSAAVDASRLSIADAVFGFQNGFFWQTVFNRRVT